MACGVQTYLISELILPLELLDKSVLISSRIWSDRCCSVHQITQGRLSSSTSHQDTGSVIVNTSKRRGGKTTTVLPKRSGGRGLLFFIIQGTESRLASEKPFHTWADIAGRCILLYIYGCIYKSIYLWLESGYENMAGLGLSYCRRRRWAKNRLRAGGQLSPPRSPLDVISSLSLSLHFTLSPSLVSFLPSLPPRLSFSISPSPSLLSSIAISPPSFCLSVSPSLPPYIFIHLCCRLSFPVFILLPLCPFLSFSLSAPPLLSFPLWFISVHPLLYHL